jgi:hypothetical protein
MEELQERREQLEMLMQWREGLRDLTEETVDRLARYWYERAPGFTLSEHGRQKLRKWSKKFSVDELTDAMDTAADQYLQFTNEGAPTQDSWNIAYEKVPGICMVTRREKEDPHARELYYIRGILRNRIPGYFDDAQALQFLRNARSWEVPIEALREIALTVRNWTQFRTAVSEAIAERERRLLEPEEESP